ncbi:molybdate ABC transporter substrate-binding protein [Sulfitobacter sp. D35]|uniref:molybdate ABC transporter substrate-binding protein n=1 Tax=Sulfitobacter sp. D35 TaxID=3083252 RepID=UPI00296E99EC|nr:molybdate ABC transporter substrate-binding protein [Sulfitobacter sp. D35]MDW4497067.1 molybdate ABC transporter substrate-binding protein [Sulfitobacter sp. D35]
MFDARRLLAILLLVFTCPGASSGAPALTVFAAASLRGALDEVAGSYEAPVAISYGGSGAMARQVQQGAPADLVILADGRWMDLLEQDGRLVPGTRRDLLGNTLVLIGAAGVVPMPDPDAERLLDRLDGGRLAMGRHDAVPAGGYAKAWLEAIGAWPALKPHLAETADVRGALAFVALGEAPLGVVYATDAMAEPRVKVVWHIPEETHPPILYPVAAITAQGSGFLDHLATPEAAAIFTRHGFVLLGVGN